MTSHGGALRGGRMLTAAAVALALVAAAAFVLTRGDDRPGAQLRALKGDPMARYAPARSRLARTVATDDSPGGTFSKQQTAKYTRLFSLRGLRPELALDNAIAAARDAGWSVSEGIAGVSAIGRKQLRTGPATLAISLTTATAGLPEGVRPPAMTVTLEHLRV